jgi:NADH-quinone oxidoreductase subunit M
MSFAQEDLKRLIAYSSVSHMGFVVLGLAIGTKAGIQGAMLQMFNHGISTSALFILVGVLYKRTHTRMLSDYGGISGIVPYFTFYFVLFSIASVALPGTGNFISEILVIFASFKEKFSYGVILAFAPFFAALYMLKAVKKTLWGPLKKKELKYLQDLYLNERIVLFILMFFVFLVGLLPTTILYLLKGG